MENNDKIEVLDFTEETQVPNQVPTEIPNEEAVVKSVFKPKPLPIVRNVNSVSNYSPTEKEIREIKEIKKQGIKDFNEDPKTKEFGVIAIGKKTYIGLWTFAIICVLLLGASMFWHNSILDKFSDKNFSPTINNNIEPANVSVPVTFTDAGITNIYNNYTLVNNYSIINNNTIIIRNGTI